MISNSSVCVSDLSATTPYYNSTNNLQFSHANMKSRKAINRLLTFDSKLNSVETIVDFIRANNTNPVFKVIVSGIATVYL